MVLDETNGIKIENMNELVKEMKTQLIVFYLLQYLLGCFSQQ